MYIHIYQASGLCKPHLQRGGPKNPLQLDTLSCHGLGTRLLVMLQSLYLEVDSSEAHERPSQPQANQLPCVAPLWYCTSCSYGRRNGEEEGTGQAKAADIPCKDLYILIRMVKAERGYFTSQALQSI